MDADTLKTLLTITAGLALLFLMMRYGCGVHVLGRHGRHHGHGQGEAGTRDPVCGMAVGVDAPAGAAVYQGRTYYFCSRLCRDKFESSPELYLARAAPERADA